MHWVYYVGRFLSRVILYSLSSWRVKGRENIPDQGPFEIASVHLDGPRPLIMYTDGTHTSIRALSKGIKSGSIELRRAEPYIADLRTRLIAFRDELNDTTTPEQAFHLRGELRNLRHAVQDIETAAWKLEEGEWPLPSVSAPIDLEQLMKEKKR